VALDLVITAVSTMFAFVAMIGAALLCMNALSSTDYLVIATWSKMLLKSTLHLIASALSQSRNAGLTMGWLLCCRGHLWHEHEEWL